jgi:hypothetical protein
MLIGPRETNGCWFRLSNAQKKELKIRGAELRLAIPVIAECDTPLTVARLALPEDAASIVDAYNSLVTVQPKPVGDAPNSLAMVLGQIIDDEHDELRDGLHVDICVIVVVLCDVPKPRATKRLQWPQLAFTATGRQFPTETKI